MPRRFVIFGASGNLTYRYLLRALAQLQEAGKLPAGLVVLGVDRVDWDREAFRRFAREALEERAAHVALAARQALLEALDYRRADATDPAGVARALAPLDEPVIAYLALPTAVAVRTAEALAGLRLPAGSRVVAEKPFGTDLASARALNELLHRSFPEQAVFRMDHFLGKQTVQNILGLRFANRVFEYQWNRDHVERVEITWDETVTAAGRASYYDRSGALRDMVQNHLLQLLALAAMEAPLAFNERDLRDQKVEVLRAVRKPSPEEVGCHTARGRYTAGRVGGRDVAAYVDEPGVDSARGTETYARVTLFIDNWRWAGVPFVLRTGKALARDLREIAVHFRPVPHLAFESEAPARNVLRFRMDPDALSLGVNINGPGDPFDLEHVQLCARFPPHELPAYGRLLLDVLEGDPTLSIRGDEAEESWRIVEPILAAWSAGRVPLQEYPAGSLGPEGEAA